MLITKKKQSLTANPLKMYYFESASRRIRVLTRILNNFNSKVSLVNIRGYVSNETVSIGNTVKEVKKANQPEYVPKKYCKFNL